MKSSLSLLLLNCVLADKPKLMVGSPEYHNSWVEKSMLESSYKTYIEEITTRGVEHGRRPVIGILTEPMRGSIDATSQTSYIPKAHVQFLEQSGIRVVPVDYRLSHADRD